MDEHTWIDWHGGECPTEWGVPVEVRYADGRTWTLADGSDASWAWYDRRSPDRIIAYRAANSGDRP